MVGLKEARENEPLIDEEAQIVEAEGIMIDEELGLNLLNKAQEDIIDVIKRLI